MFIHQSRLEHLLDPSCYWSHDYLQTERERLFLPAWHFVASRADLPKDGDFLTLQLLERSLLIRNFGGEYRCFLNVCAHRHCELVSRSQGNCPTLKCQYHGWEYDQNGRTGRIPEAKAFAPWERDRAHLTRYRTEMCGELIFVSLAPDGPSLREFLGETFDDIAATFSHPWKQCWELEFDCQANWKIVVENSLESYHLTCVHSKSFGETPAEEYCTHVLNDRYTMFHEDIQTRPNNKLQSMVMRLLGGQPTNRYSHLHVMPSFAYTRLDSFRMAHSYLPLTPRTSRSIMRLYAFRGDRQNVLARLVAWLNAYGARMTAKKILAEDGAILPAIQRGNECTDQRGVLGTREERLFVFQQYVAERCGRTCQSTAPAHDSTSRAVA